MNNLVRRIIVATIVGLLCGVWNHYNMVMLGCTQVPLAITISMIGSFGIIGFTIGISILKIKWIWHGALIGIIGNLPASLPLTLLGDIRPFLIISLLGMFYGVIIELFTTVIFRLKR